MRLNIELRTTKAEELIDITEKVSHAVKNIKEGICVVHCFHTTAAITINESADPAVRDDILKALAIFNRDDYKHNEDNSHAHVKASCIGSSVTIPIHEEKLALGAWQGIFFCEFDGPRQRRIVNVSILKAS